MKFGKQLEKISDEQFRNYNLSYNNLKKVIHLLYENPNNPAAGKSAPHDSDDDATAERPKDGAAFLQNTQALYADSKVPEDRFNGVGTDETPI